MEDIAAGLSQLSEDVSIDDEEPEETYEGQINQEGNPDGRGTLYFDKEKVERFEGHFTDGSKEGKGHFYFKDGSTLSGYFKNNVLQGSGIYTYEDGSFMVGKYKDGDLHGPAEEYDGDGRLISKGKYTGNRRIGIWHFYPEYGGHIFGVVDRKGRMSGSNIVYAYPDNKTFLRGTFKDGVLVTTHLAELVGVGSSDNPHSYQKVKHSPLFSRDISTSTVISSNPLLPDPYEEKRVTVETSSILDAHEGLFSLIESPPGEVMAFYNGIRITHKEVDDRDWKHNDNTISLDQEFVIDVPKEWSSTCTYKASLGHKANHSFQPNCKYDKFHHPRFGFIKCIRTIKSVSCGDELTVAYGYDHTKLETDAPEWYKNKLKVWEAKCKERT